MDLKYQSGDPISIKIKNRIIGRETFTVIAGPCTIENYEDLKRIVLFLQSQQIVFFRGGAYKLRTSPYNFSGLGAEGLEIIERVARETGTISVSEIVSSQDVDLMAGKIDILQVGTRNMHNYRLLQALGRVANPIILKRGMSSTIEEWLFAAEHIIAAGNPRVILCERGIRTYEPLTRNTLDISAVPAVKKYSNLPIIVDPSHSSGRRDMIKALSWAAAAAGADGIMVETHFAPDSTSCDSQQTINESTFLEILASLPQLISLWQKRLT
ncbi:MAG: 3-deoxy-7-phosphoheptulonate synthase [Candidatus Cloacimonetes bacterium]|nr:3-deoxy-7-phosphoheptulonate synthase [Candidatus Cloacimonadota bacterium]